VSDHSLNVAVEFARAVFFGEKMKTS